MRALGEQDHALDLGDDVVDVMCHEQERAADARAGGRCPRGSATSSRGRGRRTVRRARGSADRSRARGRRASGAPRRSRACRRSRSASSEAPTSARSSSARAICSAVGWCAAEGRSSRRSPRGPCRGPRRAGRRSTAAMRDDAEEAPSIERGSTAPGRASLHGGGAAGSCGAMGRMSRVSRPTKVDLPAPFGPRTATRSPATGRSDRREDRPAVAQRPGRSVSSSSGVSAGTVRFGHAHRYLLIRERLLVGQLAQRVASDPPGRGRRATARRGSARRSRRPRRSARASACRSGAAPSSPPSSRSCARRRPRAR